MILVELSNLTFEQEHGPRRDSNVKFAPLDDLVARLANFGRVAAIRA